MSLVSADPWPLEIVGMSDLCMILVDAVKLKKRVILPLLWFVALDFQHQKFKYMFQSNIYADLKRQIMVSLLLIGLTKPLRAYTD